MRGVIHIFCLILLFGISLNAFAENEKPSAVNEKMVYEVMDSFVEAIKTNNKELLKNIFLAGTKVTVHVTSGGQKMSDEYLFEELLENEENLKNALRYTEERSDIELKFYNDNTQAFLTYLIKSTVVSTITNTDGSISKVKSPLHINDQILFELSDGKPVIMRYISDVNLPSQ